MDDNEAKRVSHTDNEALEQFLKKVEKDAQIKHQLSHEKELIAKYNTRMLFLAAAAVVLTGIGIIISILLKDSGPERPVPDPIVDSNNDSTVQSYYDFEEIYFRVGQSHLEEGYADKVMSLLNRIPKSMDVQNDEEQKCHILIICSGDSRGKPELTREISDKRACEVKNHIAGSVKGVNKRRWKKAKLWSFGTTVTPGLRRRGGEDFNCNCLVIATTDVTSTRQRYLEKLRDLKPRDKLRNYEIDDCYELARHPSDHQ